jgi:retinol dehydrogenase-12
VKADAGQALNPGNLRSELQRHIHPILDKVLGLILYPAVNGAYTELFAGLSPEVPDMPKGSWVVPFGRVMKLRKDLATEDKGGEFWEWCEKQVASYT